MRVPSDHHVRKSARRETVRVLRIQSAEPGGNHEVQGNLSGVSLPQHRDQEPGNGRTALSHDALTFLRSALVAAFVAKLVLKYFRGVGRVCISPCCANRSIEAACTLDRMELR